ncbi:helix-turn-helix domain-containing protein [Sphingobacterium spiritivorum]|uniref:helix-turn-helix domain-containing protein n=1 Tax=Sphingobacterium spiritivorum TaxID=258 RepID=UPI000DFB0574|nr:helix-turn-helix transcriptional regulator [Sphingobacterium spiritivorum]QQT36026.1 helix-turn-helix transcriptional regulator [Sphingobacterium spiritivorum]WQD32756.1 helix-turn-helix transcriptional regulator [Sphingobacterium spiritivorum]SUJ14400.1 DNA-binding transcriptional regulator AraC [Sphingobacterium spiritivorum]
MQIDRILPDRIFNALTLLIGLLTLLHLAALFLNIGIPFSLLYGPILYLIQQTFYKKYMRIRQMLIHLIPFILCTVWIYSADTSPILFYSYSLINTLMVCTSSMGYTVMILLNMKKWTSHPENIKVSLFIKLFFIFCAIEFGFLTLVLHHRLQFDYDIDPMIIICLLSVLSALLSFDFLIRRLSSSFEQTNAAGRKLSIAQLPFLEEIRMDEAHWELYRQDLVRSVEEQQLYLDTGLSADRLADEIGISRQQLSVLLNNYLGKNFYEWIAEYRIAHAVKLFREGGYILKIESLAFQCGFNSKTTFNKYFKHYMGITPSEFREHLSLNKQ